MTRSNRHAETEVTATLLITGGILLSLAAASALLQATSNPQTPTGMSVMSGISDAIASTGREGVYLFIVIVLISINITKFLRTSNIYSKLEGRDQQASNEPPQQ